MIATTRLPHTGSTAPGLPMNRLEITTAKTAFTSSSRKKITSMKSTRPRSPTIFPASVPIEFALWRVEIHSVPKSCTAPAKMVPSTTHRNAGSHPQMTAIAGPTMGAAPATEVKWWPNSTLRLVGRKSTPSSNSCAGVRKSGSSR